MKKSTQVSEKIPTANRQYKDTVFRMLFSEKENLLSLYNAVTGSHYQNAEALKIVTLEYAIYVARVRKYASAQNLNDAVERAITECIKEGILVEFLRKNRSEVM